jgi:acyl transferase domain-containing protein
MSDLDMQYRLPIAIVGMGCRMPQADGVDAFWRLLQNGVDAISEVPPSRWDVDSLWSADAAPGKTYCRWGGFVADGDQFDASIFGIDEREAAFMDPQQGMVLECAWHALEHAGIAPTSLRGSATGTFVGISNCDFDRKLCSDLQNLELLAGTGTSYSIVANRLAYALGLCGPSIAVDLACASSLVAVHLACQSLLSRECDLALAGGVHLILSAEKTVTFSRGNVLARDGRCKSFADNADGYVRGEGCGMIALKRLSDAERDGDPIVAVIRGSATNHNGASNGLSAPLGSAQERVIRSACTVAGVDPATIGYIEAHSPGTLLGDLIEVRALAKVLTPGRKSNNRCLLGSVKSNIGHLEGAAGIASLIKAALAVKVGCIPPTLHAENSNRSLPLIPGALEVATCSTKWNDACRRAGVSSFSFGGANAHVLIEAAPGPSDDLANPLLSDLLLTLSAQTPDALQALMRTYDEYLGRGEVYERLSSICYTAAIGRAHLKHRVALIARSALEAQQSLRAAHGGRDGLYVGTAAVRVPAVELRLDAAHFDLAKLQLSSGLQHRMDRLVVWFESLLAEKGIDRDQRIIGAGVMSLIALLRSVGIAPAWIRVNESQGWTQLPEMMIDAVLTQAVQQVLSQDIQFGHRTQVIDRETAATHAGGVLVINAASPGASSTLLQMVAVAYTAGINPLWNNLFDEERRSATVPKYPFQRDRHWTRSIHRATEHREVQHLKRGSHA